MQEESYSIWDFKKVTLGTEVTIYYNDFLVNLDIQISARQLSTANSWTQIGTMSVGSDYAPNHHIFTVGNLANLYFLIQSNGNVMYRNTGSTIPSGTYLNINVTYPRKSALP